MAFVLMEFNILSSSCHRTRLRQLEFQLRGMLARSKMLAASLTTIVNLFGGLLLAACRTEVFSRVATSVISPAIGKLAARRAGTEAILGLLKPAVASVLG
jgi:hypothetical protein